jgi:hypothetical protein
VRDRGKCFEMLELKYFYRSQDPRELRDIFESTAVSVCRDAMRELGPPFWFTNHGIRHSDAVLHYALSIADRVDEFAGYLSELEAMALACACYLHDLGMAVLPEGVKLADAGYSVDLIKTVRHGHVTAIDRALPMYKDKLKGLYDWDRRLAVLLPLVCKAHGTEAHKKSCDELSTAGIKEFRGDLLGKILLLADELDLSQHRSSVNRHPHFECFPDEAKAHQFKHHYILDVDVQLPQIRVEFAFPDDMDLQSKGDFVRWTCGKLRAQIDMVSRDQPAQYRNTFDFHILPDERRRTPAEMCPDCILSVAKDLATSYTYKAEHRRDKGKDRPNHHHQNRDSPRTQGPLYPELDRLMDEFFRECTTLSAMKVLGQLYTHIPENDRVARELVERVDRYCSTVTDHGADILPSWQPFVIAGGTGAGKTALLNYLRHAHGMTTQFLPLRTARLIVYVDCLPYRSFEQIIRAMISGLAFECQASKRIVKALNEAGWDLRPSAVAHMSADVAADVLLGVVKFLHALPHQPLPTCFILDNVDRLPGFAVKREITVFAAKQATKGFPFFAITLRYPTKRAIDREISELGAIPTHEVRPPGVVDLLSSRLSAAFSDEVLGDSEAWCGRADIQRVLDRMKFRFDDLREALKSALCALTVGYTDAHIPLIPAMAGTNMRNALTLFRAIVKTVNLLEFANLSKGHYPEHYLIECAVREGYQVYFAANSKIRNIFDPEQTGFYFAKLYLLDILHLLSHAPEGEAYVDYLEWKEACRRNGISSEVFLREAWDLMIGDFALVEVEGVDDVLPDETYRHIEEMPSDAAVRLSSAGRYYLLWLVFDISYLQCILEDTLMDAHLAVELSQSRTSKQAVAKHVEKFLDFLEQRETAERSAWASCGVPPLVPRLRERFEFQRQSLTKGRWNGDSTTSTST